MGFAHGPKTYQIWYQWGPDLEERIYLKPLFYGIVKTCSCNVMVICPFAPELHLPHELLDCYVGNRHTTYDADAVSKDFIYWLKPCFHYGRLYKQKGTL